MPWPSRSGFEKLYEYPYNHLNDAGIAAAAFYEYGPGGDEDPGTRVSSGDIGTVLINPEIVSHGTDVIYVGNDIPDMVIGNHMSRVPLGGSIVLEGIHSTVIIYHAVGATGTAKWSVNSRLGRMSNNRNNPHPGHAREMTGTVTGVQNSTVTTSLTAPFALTVTAVKIWAPASPSTAGTYTLAVEKNGSDDMLASSPFDLTTLVAGTTSSLSLTGTTANLQLVADDYVRLAAAASNNALTSPTFYALVECTKT